MRVKNIHFTNFRNFENKTFDFRNVNLILGSNASGKSTVLEGINILSTGKSSRANVESELVSFNKHTGFVEGVIDKENEEVRLFARFVNAEFKSNKSKKQIKVNGVPRLVSSLVGNFTCVLFTPEDMNMILGSPSIRRKYLDNVLSQTSKDYRKTLSNLNKAIKNRNKILEKINKEGRGREELPFWNETLLSLSGKIHEYRETLVTFVNEHISLYGKELNGADSIFEIDFKKNLVTYERLIEYEQREIASKMTLIGPARDDFIVKLNEKSLNSYGSRGQQRTAVLALKLCEIDFITQEKNERPVLLLDDIFSELDEIHKQKVMSVIDMQQTIITTADTSIKFSTKDLNITQL